MTARFSIRASASSLRAFCWRTALRRCSTGSARRSASSARRRHGSRSSALAALGFLLHSMRVSFYYAAGRAIPLGLCGLCERRGRGRAAAALRDPARRPFLGNRRRLRRLPWPRGRGPVSRSAAAANRRLLADGFPRGALPGDGPRFGLIAAAAAASGLLAVAGSQMAVNALVELTGAGRIFAAFVVARRAS